MARDDAIFDFVSGNPSILATSPVENIFSIVILLFSYLCITFRFFFVRMTRFSVAGLLAGMQFRDLQPPLLTLCQFFSYKTI